MSTSRIALACEGIEVDTPAGCQAENGPENELSWTELNWLCELRTFDFWSDWTLDSARTLCWDWGPVVSWLSWDN